MKNLKVIGTKFLLLIVILIGMNWVYTRFFFESDLQTHSPIINLVREVVDEKAEVVYVAESSNFTSRGDDVDKRAISEFVNDYFPTLKVGSLSKEASHAGIFYEMLRNIPEDAAVKILIVTLNLRSFNANWIYSNLETPLQKSIVLLKPYPPLFKRFLLSFKGYDIKTEKEREQQFKDKWRKDTLRFPNSFPFQNVTTWDSAMAWTGIHKSDGSLDGPATELACSYIKTYAFQIDTLTNPRIKDFDNIVALSKKRHWQLIFNLMAENTERAELMVGKELTYFIRQNRDLLVKRYNKAGVMVVDNLDLVPDAEYIDRNWTTEHYAEQGRKIIARNVAKSLAKLYPKDFREVTYSQSTKPTRFFNDCEGVLKWGQMQTLTTEKAISGKKSSKTGQGQEFSITFEYPTSSLPDSIIQVRVRMQVLQTDLNQDAKLTMELSGNNQIPTLNVALIKDLCPKAGKWVTLEHTFTLPTDYRQNAVIKVYIFNPTQTVIYMDDVEVRVGGGS
jgi:hypothetical protein